MTTLENNSRIAKLNQERSGDFVVYIGYKDDPMVFMSEMQVVDRRTYKREKAALKFCNQWLNG